MNRQAEVGGCDADLALSLLKEGVKWNNGPAVEAKDKTELYPLVLDTLVRLHFERSAKALQRCEQAVASEPGNIDDRMTLIRAYLKAGQCGRAQESLGVAEKKFPGTFKGLPPAHLQAVNS